MVFFDEYLAGQISGEQIDDAINEWHTSGPEVTCELHEYLGMSWEEYGLWVTTCDLEAVKKLRNTYPLRNSITSKKSKPPL